MHRMVTPALAAALLASCSSPESTTPTDDRPVLRLAGSEVLSETLLPELAETHTRARGTLRFSIKKGAADDGIPYLLSGDVDVVATITPHRARDEAQAKQNGFSLEAEGARQIVGVDVIALAVHSSNPTDSLTYDQVIGIFCEGPNRVDNWSFLGQEARPIRAVTPDIHDGTRMVFEDFFCGGKGLSQQVEILNAQAIQNALESDATVISYVSLNQESGKVLGLRPDAAAPAVRPSQQQVIRGAYPLYRDVYLYTRGPATGAAEAFVDWVMSPAGQDVVDENHFVPLFLRPERLDEPRPLRETVHFEPGSSEPNQRSSARLRLLVEELRERAGAYQHVVLEGYTDSREGEATALSQQRAEAVRDLLAKELPGVYFEIIPRGARNPIAPNETTYGRQRNRRVQVYLAEEEVNTAKAALDGGE
jgi:phosphate transport system substrate-binding protein